VAQAKYEIEIDISTWRWRLRIARLWVKFHLAYAWWRLRNSVLALASGPECGCGERAWSYNSARRRGWKWTTWYGGEPAWVCSECLRNDWEGFLR
jgi:hypothetical protein